jgi:hypothetical protein
MLSPIPGVLPTGLNMNEELLNRLRSKLRRRKEQLEATNSPFFLPKLLRFWRFVKDEPAFASILEELRKNTAGQDAARRVDETDIPQYEYSPAVREYIASLTSEADVAAMAYHLLEWSSERRTDLDRVSRNVWGNHPGNLNNYTTFKPEVILPLCDYLDEKLDEQQALLGLLVRYKHRSEWFNRRELLKKVKEEEDRIEEERKKGKKTKAQVEDVLKEDLYLYLHDQGINFTIEPKSDRGRIDLILDQKEGTRKYLEGKVFDNKGRGKPEVVQGFAQTLRYLKQHNASNGYLFIYKTCEEALVIDGADQVETIDRVRCECGFVFIVVIDIHEYADPVSVQTYKPVRITVEELTKADPVP